MAFAAIAKRKSFYFLQNDGFPGFQRSSLCVKTVEVHHIIINFVDTQFRESLSVFPWDQNYGFCRDREMKIILFSPKRQSSGRSIEFFNVTVGFQRSSCCVKTVEVRHRCIFWL